MPLIAKDYWFVPVSLPGSLADRLRVSLLFGNSLYLIAFSYYSVITFLGYNGESVRRQDLAVSKLTRCNAALPFLQHTELLLAPVPVLVILWIVSLFTFNLPKHLAPVLWAGASLRRNV